MNLKWKNTDITKYVVSVMWSGSDTQCSRILEFSVIYDPYNGNLSTPDMKLGDQVSLLEGGNLLFVGEIKSRERSGEIGTIGYSAMDPMYHLVRSKASKNYKNITAEKITDSICNIFKIKIGSVVKTNVNIKKLLPRDESIYNIIMAAYNKATTQTKKKYMLCMDGTNVSIKEKGEDSGVVLKQNYNIIGSQYEENTDSMINQVAIYDEKGKQTDIVLKQDWIKQFGVFQETYTKEEGINSKTAAQNILRGIEKTASVEALGDVKAVSGSAIQIQDNATKLTGKYWITSDEHTWQDGIYTMSLELAFQNIMEEITVNEEEETKKNGNAGRSQNATINKVTELAKSFAGKVRYNMGSSSPEKGISDCSGYTQYCFRKAAGIDIGRTTNSQVKYGEKVYKSELKIGDLVMFKGTYNSGYTYGVSHVGIYIGQNNFIHCGSKGVGISSLKENYWVDHWLMGRRVIK